MLACRGCCCLAVGWRQAAVQLVPPVLEHASNVVPLRQEVSHRQLAQSGEGGRWQRSAPTLDLK